MRCSRIWCVTGDPTLDTVEEVANRLSQELAIDCKSSGSQRTTRLEQAIETIQGVLFATRMGRFPTTPVLGTVNPSASWVLTTSLAPSIVYSKDKFDLEWQWLGAFSTWRAARLVFGYPENYLLPSLRPPKGSPQGREPGLCRPRGPRAETAGDVTPDPDPPPGSSRRNITAP